MSRGALTNVTIMQPTVVRDSGKMSTPLDRIKTAKFFQNFTPSLQRDVLEESKMLAASLFINGSSEFAIGQRLYNLREMLEPKSGRPSKDNPKKTFAKVWRAFNLKERTTYRYINQYERAKEKFPPMILECAAASGINLVPTSAPKDQPFGRYTEVLRQLPPPERNPSEEAAKRYLTQLEQLRKERQKRLNKAKKSGSKRAHKVEHVDPEVALKECFRFVNLRFENLASSRQKGRLIENLAGMFIGKLGMRQQTIDATAVPEGYEAERGRPRLVKDKEEEAAATTA